MDIRGCDFKPQPFPLLFRLERDLVVRPQKCDGVLAPDKVRRAGLLVERVVPVGVAVALPPLLLGLEDVCLRVLRVGGLLLLRRRRRGELLEDVLWVEELWIDMLRRMEFAADDKDLC